MHRDDAEYVLHSDDPYGEMKRQLSMAWSRGFQLGLAIGIAGAVIWSLIVVIIILTFHG